MAPLIVVHSCPMLTICTRHAPDDAPEVVPDELLRFFEVLIAFIGYCSILGVSGTLHYALSIGLFNEKWVTLLSCLWICWLKVVDL